MRVLLVSTYELGHQPLHLASPAAALERAGHEVRCVDLSVEGWDMDAVRWAEVAAFSVPMHTAMRLASRAAEGLKRARPDIGVCFYGLYAKAGPSVADRVIAGEYEGELVSWVEGLAPGPDVVWDRQRYTLPVRAALPPLERYAHLEIGEDQRPAGYVEATHGCVHRCRHCPVPVVYDGRTRKVPLDVVLADVDRLVGMGARHITFGDPDFLNRWRHALEVVEAVHAAFPHLTYDVTTKVEHILRYEELLRDLARTGCLFAVSAFETTNDRILGLLDKGHTTAEASRAVELLRSHAIEVRPSWLPFTPWTTVQDVVDILDFVLDHDLVGSVDPVQYTVRLLVPKGSLLLDLPEMPLGPYDDEKLTYTWTAVDPRVDPLQARLHDLVEASAGDPPGRVYLDVRGEVLRTAGATDPVAIEVGSIQGRPRLTEPWFC